MPTVQQRAVEVRHQRAHVPLREAATVAIVPPEVAHQSLLGVAPARVVPFVAAVDLLAGFGDADLPVRQQELSDRRIEGEAGHALSGGVHEDGRRPVHHVAGRHLLEPRLQAILERAVTAFADAAVDREDGSDRDVRVNVRTAVERIEQQHVVPGRELVGDPDQPFLLLGGHHAQLTVVVHGVEHHVVRILVELPHFLSVHVLLAHHAENVHQARLADLAVDQLGGEGEIVQDVGEGAGRSRMLALRFDDEAAERHDVSIHACLRGWAYGTLFLTPL